MASLDPKGNPQARGSWGKGSVKYNAKRKRWIVTMEGTPDPVTGKRRRIEASAPTKTEANALHGQMEEARKKGLDLKPKKMKLSDWLAEWLEGKLVDGLRPTTYRSYKSAIDNGINPRLGGVLLSKLTTDHVKQMTRGIVSDGGSQNAARYAHTVLAMALRDAKVEGRVLFNVAGRDGPKKPKVEPRRTPRLDAAQAMQFLETCKHDSEDDFARWAFALITGSRQGETIGLTWDRLDLDRESADLTWQLQTIPNEHGCGQPDSEVWPCRQKVPRLCPKKKDLKPPNFESVHLEGSTYLTRPKTRGSERSVPIPPKLVEYLKAHRNATADQPNPHNLVWHQRSGAPIHPRKDHARWVEILDQAGLPRVKLHSARHTAGTVLASLGLQPDAIMRVLGHTSLDMTAIYADADRETVRDFMNQMSGKIIAGEVVATDPHLTTPVPQIG